MFFYVFCDFNSIDCMQRRWFDVSVFMCQYVFGHHY